MTGPVRLAPNLIDHFYEGGARIEQVYPTEIEALRANRDNTDESRRVRFLPYGVAVSVLDAS